MPQVPGGDYSQPPTEEDLDLARRRYAECVRLMKEEPWAEFETEILPRLPLDGATPLDCGHTRFDHAIAEGCLYVETRKRAKKPKRYIPNHKR